MNAIYFDMDGTIANLYAVDGWLEMLTAEDVTPYAVAAPMYDMNKLNALMELFAAKGITIGVISWGSKYGSREYTNRVRAVKKQWIKENLPCVTEIHVVKYGTPKFKVAKIKDAILIDDEAHNRKAWKGATIDATKDIYEELMNLLDKVA